MPRGYDNLYLSIQLFYKLGSDFQSGKVPLLLGDEDKVQALQLQQVGNDGGPVRLLVGERVAVQGEARQLPHLLQGVQQCPLLQQVAVEVQQPGQEEWLLVGE